MTSNAERKRLARRILREMRESGLTLSGELLDSVAQLAANVAADWSDERNRKAEDCKTVARSENMPRLPEVVLQIEYALLEHFPEMPQYAARAVSGDVFEQLQEFTEWKVRPFSNHFLPPSMRCTEPAPPWPGDPESSDRLGFRLVRITTLPCQSTG